MLEITTHKGMWYAAFKHPEQTCWFYFSKKGWAPSMQTSVGMDTYFSTREEVVEALSKDAYPKKKVEEKEKEKEIVVGNYTLEFFYKGSGFRAAGMDINYEEVKEVVDKMKWLSEKDRRSF